jgi:RNA polymerase sigma-70 factor (ECF subfamily)
MSDAESERLREMLGGLHEECWGWALACCRGAEDTAEEVLHMSYHKVLDQRARYDGRSAFKTWLFSVIRITALDHQRWSVRRWLRFVGLEHAEESVATTPSAGEALDRRERGGAYGAEISARPAVGDAAAGVFP